MGGGFAAACRAGRLRFVLAGRRLRARAAGRQDPPGQGCRLGPLRRRPRAGADTHARTAGPSVVDGRRGAGRTAEQPGPAGALRGPGHRRGGPGAGRPPAQSRLHLLARAFGQRSADHPPVLARRAATAGPAVRHAGRAAPLRPGSPGRRRRHAAAGRGGPPRLCQRGRRATVGGLRRPGERRRPGRRGTGRAHGPRRQLQQAGAPARTSLLRRCRRRPGPHPQRGAGRARAADPRARPVGRRRGLHAARPPARPAGRAHRSARPGAGGHAEPLRRAGRAPTDRGRCRRPGAHAGDPRRQRAGSRLRPQLRDRQGPRERLGGTPGDSAVRLGRCPRRARRGAVPAGRATPARDRHRCALGGPHGLRRLPDAVRPGAPLP